MAHETADATLTVLYDEDCGLCTALARWLERRGSSLAVHAIGSETGAHLLCDLAPGARYAAFHLVDFSGRRMSGAAAVPIVARRLPGGRAFGPMLSLSPWAVRLGYGLVARQRHRLSRLLRMESCSTARPPRS